MSRRYRLFLIVSLVTLVLDQITKFWARDALKLGKGVEFIAGYWDWRLSYNTGSAFGMFHDTSYARIFLSVVGLGATGFIVYLLKKATDEQKMTVSALALVAGGAVGNVVDRIIDAKVTDFVVWKLGSREWPAFNIADVALVIGVGIMFLDVGREQKKAKAQAKA